MFEKVWLHEVSGGIGSFGFVFRGFREFKTSRLFTGFLKVPKEFVRCFRGFQEPCKGVSEGF